MEFFFIGISIFYLLMIISNYRTEKSLRRQLENKDARAERLEEMIREYKEVVETLLNVNAKNEETIKVYASSHKLSLHK